MRAGSWIAAAVLVTGCAGSASHRPSSSATTTTTISTTTTSTTSRPTAQSTTTTVGTPTGAPSWTTYQGSNLRLGDASSAPSPSALHRDWAASLDGSAVYGQPLVFDGMVIVATEDDDVFSLTLSTGKVVWKRKLGDPLTGVASKVGCGDIDPLGITSTPVIDPDTGTVYVVAELANATHELFGLDVSSGHTVLAVDADPSGASLPLLQRAALALGNGRVYIGYGGQYGDCGSYHGWVVAVSLSAGHTLSAFDATPDSSGGAVWQGGSGPAISSAGDVYAATGNANSAGADPWAEAVLELSPALAASPLASFQDRLATDDADLASGGPVLLPGGTVFVAGKTEVGYLLRESGLDEESTISGRICGSDPDGGDAYDGSLDALYVPCRGGGIQEVRLASRATGWRAGAANSTPVFAGGDLWSLEYPDGKLQAFDPSTGRVLVSVDIGADVANFASPTPIDGMILVPTLSGVVAFS